MTVQTALQQGSRLLEEGSVPAARLTAEVLLSHALGRERVWLFGHPEEELGEVAWIHYGRSLHERLQGKPTQHITGRQEFYGREFLVTPDVLIPRPETEHVVETALERAPGAQRVADIGCGSGAIAVTLALELPSQVWATDISIAALAVAAENARRLRAGVHLVACDLASALAADSFDLVASNPPYVPLTKRAGLQREVRDWEPAVALFGGSSGTEFYGPLAAEAQRLLRPGGWLVFEIGFRAEETVRGLLAGWSELRVDPDLAGLPRVVSACRRP